MLKTFRLDCSKLSPGAKVSAIKQYRNATGEGLKEAKDAIELAMGSPIHGVTSVGSPYPTTVGYTGGKIIECQLAAHITEAQFAEIKREFKGIGCEVLVGPDIHSRSVLKTQILVLECVAGGNYKYARDLLDVLIKEKEDRNV
jgi:hypothetical protein